MAHFAGAKEETMFCCVFESTYKIGKSEKLLFKYKIFLSLCFYN